MSVVFLCAAALNQPAASQSSRGPVAGIPGMPPLVDAGNLYSETAAGRLSPSVVDALQRIYVPNISSNDLYVIDLFVRAKNSQQDGRPAAENSPGNHASVRSKSPPSVCMTSYPIRSAHSAAPGCFARARCTAAISSVSIS